MLKDREIINHVTGQVIRFVKTGEETGGESLEMEAVYASFSKEPIAHFHPEQEEFFEVLSGELTVRLNSDVKTYLAGERLHIKAGVLHSMWNASYKDALVKWTVQPALETAEFLSTLTALANSGQTNSSGIPSLPLMIFLRHKYRDTFCLKSLNGKVLGFVNCLLSPLHALYKSRKKINEATYPSKLSVSK